MRNSSYSFILIVSKILLSFSHGLKISFCFQYNFQIDFGHFVCIEKVGTQYYQSVQVYGIFCVQCLLHIYADVSEMYMLLSWSGVLHVDKI